MTEKTRFINEISRQLKLIFKLVKAGKKPPQDTKYRCEGFMQAGIYLKLVNRSEMQSLMENLHHEILGETITERKNKNRTRWQEESIDYTSLDIPTVLRRHPQKSQTFRSEPD